VLNTPWSYVVRFETADGYIYLKNSPALFAIERIIIEILREKFHASVPVVIAHNAELNCFLMKDAGQSLRAMLKKQFDEVLLCRAIEQFVALQKAVSDKIDVFLNIGVPDYRLDKLPGLYKALISQKPLLIAEGLSEVEISKLEAQQSKIKHLCEKLSRYSIKQTIVQPDFNDNNTLIDNRSQAITIIDLGEIVIAHPFFSLLNCLEQIKKHHGLTDKDESYLKIEAACFKNYKGCFNSEQDFRDALVTAELLRMVYAIAYQDRFMMACGKENLIVFKHWKLGNLLKEYMAVFTAIDEP
jgi:hypothetical protein